MTVSQRSSAAIVLCGGRSQRMGRPKHLLPFGTETSLQRVVRIVREVAEPVVVVASPGQELPPLPPDVLLGFDETEHLGPLSGLVTGLRRLGEERPVAYLTGCDVPLLKPEFVRAIVDALGPEEDAVVPREEKFLHPLAAAYRTQLLPLAERLLQAGELRPRTLIESCRSRLIDVEELRAVDRDLDSLRNMNSPEDYQALLSRAGLNSGIVA